MLFRLNIAIFVKLLLRVEIKIGIEWWDCDDATNEDTEKGQTFSVESESVYLDEDNGERLKPDVEETVYQRYVQVEEENHGLNKVEHKWAN